MKKKQPKNAIIEHAKKTFKKEWGVEYRVYLNDLKRHYKLTGEVGFSLDPDFIKKNQRKKNGRVDGILSRGL